jgi:manganese efflux pump family protein
MIAVLLVALALAMDAFAVSVASGICIADLKLKHALRASLSFGLFQFAMPVIGWLLGSTFSSYIRRFDHWIAFALLGFVGGKMIKESFEAKDAASCSDDEKARADIRDFRTLMLLSVATSIDALAVGLYYSVLGAPILAPAAIIGVVTFALCLVGTEFGKRIGSRFERWATLAGGIALVGIGLKILVEHLLKSL